MEKYAVSSLVKEVKVILDRNQETAELLPDDTDTLTQGELIKSVIVDAAKAIEERAPANKLDALKTSTDKVTWTANNGKYIGVLKLQSDILRVVGVKASDWQRPGIIITENDEAYLYQSNQYIRGNCQRPVAVLAHSQGKRQLELYTSDSSSATVDMSYIPVPSIDNGTVEICSLLKDAIVYMAAYLSCVSLGDAQAASGYIATAYQLADIDVEPSQT